MNIKRRVFSCFLVLSLSNEVLSNEAFSASGWVSGLTISRVVIEPGAPGYSVFTDSEVADCEQTGKFYVKATEQEGDKVYAMALTAFTAKKQVALHVDPVSECAFGGIRSNGMWIKE